MGSPYERILRIKQIERSVIESAEKSKKTDKEKLIAFLSIDYGTSRRSALEYIDNLVIAKKIKEIKIESRIKLIPFPKDGKENN